MLYFLFPKFTSHPYTENGVTVVPHLLFGVSTQDGNSMKCNLLDKHTTDVSALLLKKKVFF